MKETKPDELFTAWLYLPDEDQRNAKDAGFADIFEMSCEKGFRAITDEARRQLQANPEALTEFVETLSALPKKLSAKAVRSTRARLGRDRKLTRTALAQDLGVSAKTFRRAMRDAA